MAAEQTPIIAREGWPPILAVLVLMVLDFQFLSLWLQLPLGLLLIVLFLLFRDPARQVSSTPLAVVSPVDGTVTEVSPTDKGVLEGECIRVTIRINSFGTYTARSPIEGKVLNLRENLSAGSRLTGVSGLWVRSEADDDVVLLFRGAGFPGRPAAFLRYGERVGKGQRFAYLRLARFADLYLPITSRVQVAVGERVTAGSGVVAKLLHK